MTDRDAATAACDSAHKDCLSKLASTFMTEYFLAEGKPDADGLRQACGQRFQAGLKVYIAAHGALAQLVAEALPGTAAAGA